MLHAGDTLEACGWSVEIADAQKVKGLAPLACKTDKIDSMVLAVLSHRDLVPTIWLPDPRIREEREVARFDSPSPHRHCAFRGHFAIPSQFVPSATFPR